MAIRVRSTVRVGIDSRVAIAVGVRVRVRGGAGVRVGLPSRLSRRIRAARRDLSAGPAVYLHAAMTIGGHAQRGTGNADGSTLTRLGGSGSRVHENRQYQPRSLRSPDGSILRSPAEHGRSGESAEVTPRHGHPPPNGAPARSWS